MEGLGEVGWERVGGYEGVSGDIDGDGAVVIRRLMDQPVVVSSQRAMARAAVTMVRWASMDWRRWVVDGACS